MERTGGWLEKIALAMAGKKSPWGKGGDGDGEPESGGDGETPPTGENKPRRSANIEDIFRQRGPEGPRRVGGGGGPNFRLPERPGGKSWFPVAIGAIALVWIGVTSFHFVQPREQGVVTWFGSKYSRTLNPGTSITFPWPIQSVSVENVSEIRLENIGGSDENLILTGDQNLVDLSYLIRWNIKDLVQYNFELAEPQETLREVAEAAMPAP